MYKIPMRAASSSIHESCALEVADQLANLAWHELPAAL
jgi:hypothetical protein